jgi:hypothetical protein
MLADAVEPHGLDELHVVPEGVVVRRGEARLGPVALVEHQAQKVGAAVEDQPVPLDGDRAQGGIADHLVEELAAFGPELELGLDERRARRAPEQLVAEVVDAGVGQGDAAVDLAGHDRVGVVGEDLGAGPELDPEAEALPGQTTHPGLEADLPARQVGSPAQAVDPGRGDLLEPHRLPDARGPGIPDRVRFELPVLLAPGLAEVGRIVVGPDHHCLLDAREDVDERVGDIGAERRVASLMADDQRAVDPDRGRPVHRSEVEEEALAMGQRRGFERPAVPATAVKAGVADPARRRLGRVGNDDGCPPGHLAGRVPALVGIDGEVPGPVQVGPAVPLQKRPGVTMFQCAACEALEGGNSSRHVTRPPGASCEPRGLRDVECPGKMHRRKFPAARRMFPTACRNFQRLAGCFRQLAGSFQRLAGTSNGPPDVSGGPPEVSGKN